ncbi:unnamed protein product [Haemonchus placei]|uniref:C2H2-type domain-containing protein n=1 Tax=Haemonchus placei TaxID=6290 RepID=A0A0N4X412_HAEPC|nr:unnamed protein product [Haemonchus placei]
MDVSFCASCGKAMSTYNSYLRHLRNVHGELGAETASALVRKRREAARASKPHKCSLCDFRGTSKGALSKHMTRSHREVLAARQNIDMELATPERRRAILCPLCPAKIDSSKTLIKHACKDHGFQGRVMTKQFGNREDFMTVENECSGIVEVEYCESHLGHCVSAASLSMLHDDSDTVIVASGVTRNAPFVEDSLVTEKSSGSAFNNNSMGTDIPEEDTSRENCMKVRNRTERMLDYLSAYVRRLAFKGNTEVQSELEKVERGIEAIPRLPEEVVPQNPRNKCGTKYDIPPRIAEDIEGDDELDLCVVCDRREHPGDLTDTGDVSIVWVSVTNATVGRT